MHNNNIIEDMREYNDVALIGAFQFMGENIADRIEREFIERPRFKNGKHVHLGDEFEVGGETNIVTWMYIDPHGKWHIYGENGVFFSPDKCTYVCPDTIKKVWRDAEYLEKLSVTERLDGGDITFLLQRLEKIIREEYKAKEDK